MNKVFLIGNLTRDPELNTTGTGIAVCRFAIAVNRTYSNASGERETDFFNISAWRGLGENCSRYLRKGSKVAVCGSVEIRNYNDKDGNKRTSVDVTADDVEFLTAKSAEGGEGAQAGAAPRVNKPRVDQLEPVPDDDLPF